MWYVLYLLNLGLRDRASKKRPKLDVESLKFPVSPTSPQLQTPLIDVNYQILDDVEYPVSPVFWDVFSDFPKL